MALMASILILLILPYVHNNKFRGLSFRPLSKILFCFSFGDFLVLTWIGGQSVEDPYILIGQIAAIFYFAYFL